MADIQAFTKPAEIAGIPEANTAILNDYSGQFLQAAHLKMAMDEAERQQKQKEIADKVNMFDFDTKGVWNPDVETIKKHINDGINKFKDVNWLKAYDNGDLSAVQEYNNWKTGVLSDIQTSKLRSAHFDEMYDAVSKDSKYQNEQTYNALNKFRDTPLSTDYPELMGAYYNPLVLPKALDSFKEDTSIEYPIGGNRTKSIQVNGYVPFDKVKDVIIQSYSDPETRRGFSNTLATMLQNPQTAETMYPVYGDNPKKEIVKQGDQSYYVTQPTGYKKLSEMSPVEAFVSFNYNPLSVAGVKQGLEGAEYSLSGGGVGGSAKGVINYEQGLPITATTVLMANGKPQTKNAEANQFTTEGGWDISKTSEAPRNLNIKPPINSYNIGTNLKQTIKDYGSEYWNVDVLGVYDVPVTEKGENFVINKDLPHKIKRYALVVKHSDRSGGEDSTMLIPYDSNISNPIENSGIKLEGYIAPQTQQNKSENKSTGLFDNLGIK